MLPVKSRYGLKALVHLARRREAGPVLIADIAQAEAIPRKFLEVILLELRNHGVLSARRGKGGGYILRQPPEAVFLGDVVRVLTGPLAPLPCLSRTAYQRCPECVEGTTCAARALMADVHAATLRIVDGMTLADLLARLDTEATAAAAVAPAPDGTPASCTGAGFESVVA